MRISDAGKMASEELVTWDSKRDKWIDQSADSTGAYATLEGTPSGNTIRYTQVFPADSSFSGVVTRLSKTTYTCSFTTTVNGKTIISNDTCTKT